MFPTHRQCSSKFLGPYLVEWREYDVAHDPHETVARRVVENIEWAEQNPC